MMWYRYAQQANNNPFNPEPEPTAAPTYPSPNPAMPFMNQTADPTVVSGYKKRLEQIMSRAGQTYEQIILALTAFKNSVNAQTEINANDKAAVIKLIDDQINTLSMHPQKTDQYKPVRHIDTGLSGVMSAFTTSVPTSASPASPTGAGGAGRSPVRGRAPGGFLGLDDAFASSNKPNSPITFIYRGFSSKQTNGMPTIPLNANEYPRILDAIQKKDITTINQIINPKKFKAILDRNGTYTIEKL